MLIAKILTANKTQKQNKKTHQNKNTNTAVSFTDYYFFLLIFLFVHWIGAETIILFSFVLLSAYIYILL